MNNLVKILLYKIDGFKGYPFKVNHDNEFNELVESIKSNGLLNPITVRKKNLEIYEFQCFFDALKI